MSEPNHNLPIGSLLQQAGLISAEQLQTALKLQQQYTQMKLGEIIVLQQGLRAKTIDFFADKWDEIVTQGQLLPLGYYLRQACLLNEQQIEIILREQKQNQDKFGVLAVRKGWIEQDTINFFLANLSSRPPQIMSLNALEAYNSQALHLEKKYANYSLIFSRILGWTGGIPVLTKAICQVFAKSDSNIPAGQEITAVDRFVEGTLIRKWQKSQAASSIRIVASSLVNNPRCSSSLLLKEYQDVLLAGSKVDFDSEEQQELLLLGLIVREDDRVEVSNIIYQQIFNHEFIVEQLNKIEEKEINTVSNNLAVDSRNTVIEYVPQSQIENTVSPVAEQADVQSINVINSVKDERSSKLKNNTPEPLTKIGSIVTGVAIALLIPLFLTINNYYSSLSNGEKTANGSQKEIDRLQESCNQLNASDLNSLLNSVANLELNQQQLQQDFPPNCEVALNRLRVMAAPQLGRESRILEAIRHLCKVPDDSEMHVEAEVWLKRWYNSADWGQETKTYLEETYKHGGGSCPVAHFTEDES